MHTGTPSANGLYVINSWFKFEDKIQNTTKVIVFTRNHTDGDTDDNDADDRTKNNISPRSGGGGDIILHYKKANTRPLSCFNALHWPHKRRTSDVQSIAWL